RKEMKGGNEATIGSGITHSPERRTKRRKRAYQNDAAKNLSGSRILSAERKPHAKSAKFAKF
ncbi:MAG: hypothetical protein IJP62_11380, partial [Treponema sp.]|nr:hypothetical protein [Treponema sp.]